MFGHPTAGIFGYSHLTGGYAGGQAEYARVPYADVGPLKIEDGLPDEQVLFLSDILPTGYMGADFCEISGGETIAVFGAGPVGQFAIASAVMLGAEQVIAIDQFDYRLEMARNRAGATDTINFDEDADVVEQLKVLTGGRGPDAVIDAVGMEAADPHGVLHAAERVKQATRSETDRGGALRDAILACRPGGIVSIIGVYGGLMDKFPMGALMNKGLHDQDRPVPRAALHEAAVRAHHQRRHRSELRRHAPAGPRTGAGRLRDVQAQAGRVREGGAQAMTRNSSASWPRPIDATLHGVTDYSVGATLMTVFPSLAGIEGTRAGRRSASPAPSTRATHAHRLPARRRQGAAVQGPPGARRARRRRAGRHAVRDRPVQEGPRASGCRTWGCACSSWPRWLLTDPTGRGDYKADVEAVREGNTEDPHRKIHDGQPAVTPAAA